MDHAYAAMEEAADQASVDLQDVAHSQEASASASVEEEGAAAPVGEKAAGSQSIREGAGGSQGSMLSSVDMEVPDTGYTAAEYAEMSYFDMSESIVTSQSSQQSCSEGSPAVYDPYQVYDLDDNARVPAAQERAGGAAEGAAPARRDMMLLRKRASGAGAKMPPAAFSDDAASSRDSPTATMLSIRAQNLMAHDQVPLQSLGQLIGSTEYGTNYERLVSNTMKGMRLDVHGLKQMQRSLSNLATSSDSVVRDLVGIVRFQGDVIIGIASALDHVLASLPVLRKDLMSAASKAPRGTEPPLPQEGTKMCVSNTTREWFIEKQPPFEAVDLRQLLRTWKWHTTHDESFTRKSTAFFRHYLRSACSPVSEIKQYSCRLVVNVGRNRKLKDIPEAVATTLVDFLLDTIGLGSANLEKTVDELRTAQHPWWMNLGCNDYEREEQFRHLPFVVVAGEVHPPSAIRQMVEDCTHRTEVVSEKGRRLRDCRAAWGSRFRQNLGDALAEFRQWPCVRGELVERKRRPTLEDRPSCSTDGQHDD